jgi:hypothetical protein
MEGGKCIRQDSDKFVQMPQMEDTVHVARTVNAWESRVSVL